MDKVKSAYAVAEQDQEHVLDSGVFAGMKVKEARALLEKAEQDKVLVESLLPQTKIKKRR